MKKLFLLLFLTACSLGARAQAGDLFVGATGGYITKYKDILYGVNAAYHVTDPLEISFTGLMNPNITEEDGDPGSATYIKSKTKIYSANFDMRFYMVLQRNWATGPFIGGQYTYMDRTPDKYDINGQYKFNIAGFNIGWHLRGNITDHLKINGGWRYTSATENASHHLIYLGIGYTFNLF